MFSELFGNYQFGAKHTANITPGKAVIQAVYSADSILFHGSASSSVHPVGGNPARFQLESVGDVTQLLHCLLQVIVDENAVKVAAEHRLYPVRGLQHVREVTVLQSQWLLHIQSL